ncbi:hypothetical protein PSYJA_07913, partial [Pseudomonas syringae pv. japonica str. M301072]
MSQKQISKAMQARQFGGNTENVMAPVSSATVGPPVSRMLGAKGRSFVNGSGFELNPARARFDCEQALWSIRQNPSTRVARLASGTPYKLNLETMLLRSTARRVNSPLAALV